MDVCNLRLATANVAQLMPPYWQEALRQRCKERLKQSRADVIDRLRFGYSNGQPSSVDSLVMEEMKALRAEADDADYAEEGMHIQCDTVN